MTTLPPSDSDPPLHSSRSILQKIDDDVSRLKCRPWKAVLHFGVDHMVPGDDKYVSIRIDAKTWWVLHGIPNRRLGKSPIPAFERIRIVTIENDGSMHCSCGYQDCYGIPDRHVSHVSLHYGTDFESWTHNDVDLRYHNTYCMLVATKDPAAMSDEEKSICTNLINARQQDFSIPLAPSITRNYGIGILKGSIIELKSRNAKRALSFCEGGVQGGIISSKVKSNTTKSKHRKQEYYPGMK